MQLPDIKAATLKPGLSERFGSDELYNKPKWAFIIDTQDPAHVQRFPEMMIVS